MEYQPFPDAGPRNWNQEFLEIPVMLKVLGAPQSKRVLEVGCGRGIALPVLGRMLSPERLVGLDIDDVLLATARKRLLESRTNAELVLGDVRMLPHEDASFDVVIDFGTCFHIGWPERALREIVRVLAPGGMFITETEVSQFLSHPVRSRDRHLPWHEAPELAPRKWAVLWQSRRRT